MKKLKAIIFDFDGKLVDSDHFHFNCWNEILSKFNINLKYDSQIIDLHDPLSTISERGQIQRN